MKRENDSKISLSAQCSQEKWVILIMVKDSSHVIVGHFELHIEQRGLSLSRNSHLTSAILKSFFRHDKSSVQTLSRYWKIVNLKLNMSVKSWPNWHDWTWTILPFGFDFRPKSGFVSIWRTDLITWPGVQQRSFERECREKNRSPRDIVIFIPNRRFC